MLSATLHGKARTVTSNAIEMSLYTMEQVSVPLNELSNAELCLHKQLSPRSKHSGFWSSRQEDFSLYIVDLCCLQVLHQPVVRLYQMHRLDDCYTCLTMYGNVKLCLILCMTS